jgi:outer membrane protein
MKWATFFCALPLLAQVAVNPPAGPVLIRPYEATTVPAAKLTNSPRLHDLVRAGKIRLTAQDAIALAIENNLDIETQRYGKLIAEWSVERSEAGGLLRGVGNSGSQIGQVASGQGISGSQRSAGVSSNTGGSAAASGNASISQIGPVTANLDAVLQNTTLFSHTTTPQSNSVQSQTNSLVDGSHIYNTSLQQGFLTGGYVQASFSESYLRENTLTDVLNPSVAPRAQIYVQHNLLQGLGTKVNNRFIRVAKNNNIATQQTFRSNLINVITNVLNLYWDLVSDEDDLAAKRKARDVAQKFLDDTRKQIEIGTVAKSDLFRAQGEAELRKEAYALAQGTEEQQQNLLKNVLSRNGLEDAILASLPIEAVDRMPAPDTRDLPPLREMVAKAMAKRPDIAAAKLNAQSAEISAYGTDNGLLPTLVGYASTTQSGLSGTPIPQAGGGGADPYFAGGLGNALGQVVRRNFPSNRAGISMSSVPVFVDHADQADYAIDQLQLRQTQLTLGRDLNQLVVDISNQAVALRQSRARYETAVKARAVQEVLLAGEQNKFNLASSNLGNVVLARRSLSAAEETEAAALAAYNHARIALEQVLGETLEANNVTVETR